MYLRDFLSVPVFGIIVTPSLAWYEERPAGQSFYVLLEFRRFGDVGLSRGYCLRFAE